MALREDRQALLDVFCHCYGLLLEHLDFLNGAVGAHDGWSGYRLVQECVDTAANRLGGTPLETIDRQEVCREFLRLIRGGMGYKLMEYKLEADSPVFVAFSNYAADVGATPSVSCTDLTEWQCVGEDISRACYCRLLPADEPALCLSVEPVDLVGCNKPRLQAEADKTQGQGRIIFGFAPCQFTFADYVNLPFFFLHEYLSHLHTAPTFAECQGVQKHHFTDGWLLYYERLAYWRALFDELHPALCSPSHRDHYVQRYLYNNVTYIPPDEFRNESEKRLHWMICNTYELAERFDKLVGEERFERVTLLFASTPYDVLSPQPFDLHGEFVQRIQSWLRLVAALAPEEREDFLTTLDTLLDGPDPVCRIMEWLKC